ncbi:TRM11 family SAM-dependent methyltransferase [Verrucomicrobiota bacterium]
MQRRPRGQARHVRWRGCHYELRRIYEEEKDAYRSQAPDRNEFLLARGDGAARLVRGYRGSSQPGERRGLPVCDARLLVNLVSPPGCEGRLLDPFAGAGGIVRHAMAAGLDTFSSDIDPCLAPGLTHLGSDHRIGDARQLPFPDEFFDAIATEPPYDETHGDVVVEAVPELSRLLKRSGRMSMLCAEWQTEEASRRAERLCLRSLLCSQIDRKGLGCMVIAWEKQAQMRSE